MSARMHVFGNYEIQALLGKGGMAEVYRAKVLSGPREGWQVAIKRLAPALSAVPEYVELFTTEADLSKFLDHPNIVKVYEIGVIENIYYMAMEWVDGRDLGQILRRCKQRQIPLPVDFAVYLAKVLLDALGYAHEAKGPSGNPLGIVHSDVSPSNLFISRTGEIKLGDFGIARANLSAAEPSLFGKPYYLSPEAIDGEVTPQSDVWAAAVTLYEMLTGDRPFKGANPDEVFAAIRARRRPAARELRPEIRPELELIFERAFSEDLDERFQTAAEMAEALAPLYDDSVGTPLGIAAVVRGLFGAH